MTGRFICVKIFVCFVMVKAVAGNAHYQQNGWYGGKGVLSSHGLYGARGNSHGYGRNPRHGYGAKGFGHGYGVLHAKQWYGGNHGTGYNAHAVSHGYGVNRGYGVATYSSHERLCKELDCLNGATCISKRADKTARCVCPIGYTGDRCEINIDDCTSNPCVNGNCIDGVNSFTCICNPGYKGMKCDMPVCRTGWKFFMGSCYYFSTDRKRFIGAQISCKEKGADLIKLETIAERDWTANEISNEFPTAGGWIGLTDDCDEGTYQWIKDATVLEMGIENWGTSQPSGRPLENCVRIRQDKTWTDRLCRSRLNYVCEEKVIP